MIKKKKKYSLWAGLQKHHCYNRWSYTDWGILPAIPAMGKHLEKLAKWLGGFQTIIEIIAIILGIWGLL